MADLTILTPVDTFLQSADQAAMRTALGTGVGVADALTYGVNQSLGFFALNGSGQAFNQTTGANGAVIGQDLSSGNGVYGLSDSGVALKGVSNTGNLLDLLGGGGSELIVTNDGSIRTTGNLSASGVITDLFGQTSIDPNNRFLYDQWNDKALGFTSGNLTGDTSAMLQFSPDDGIAQMNYGVLRGFDGSNVVFELNANNGTLNILNYGLQFYYDGSNFAVIDSADSGNGTIRMTNKVVVDNYGSPQVMLDGTNGNVTAGAFFGDGTQVTNLEPYNLVGFPNDGSLVLLGNGTWDSAPLPSWFDGSGHGYNSSTAFSLDAVNDWDGSTQVGYGADGSSYGAAFGLSAKAQGEGVAFGSYAVANGSRNIALGNNATVPDGWENTTEIGFGAATLQGGLNFRGFGIVDYNSGSPNIVVPFNDGNFSVGDFSANSFLVSESGNDAVLGLFSPDKGTTYLYSGDAGTQPYLQFPNSTKLQVGSFDNSTGGANGISLLCAAGYELNWQGGRLKNTNDGGVTASPIIFDSQLQGDGTGFSGVVLKSYFSGTPATDFTATDSAGFNALYPETASALNSLLTFLQGAAI